MIGSIFYSFVLAQILGLFLIVHSIVLLSRIKYYREVLNSIKLPSLALYVGASCMLIIGLFLVDIHNIWVLKPRLLVTIIAWIILIKSVLWLSIPEKMLLFSQKTMRGPGIYAVIFVMAFAGCMLMTKGFYLYMSHSYIA